MRRTLDASLYLVKETLLKFRTNTDSIKNLIGQVIEVYLECIRLNQGIDDSALEKVLHSVTQVCQLFNEWVVESMGTKFGISKSQWSGRHWLAFQAENEIKVTMHCQLMDLF